MSWAGNSAVVCSKQMGELTASQSLAACCSTCKTCYELTPHKRDVKSADGVTEL